MSKPDTDKLFAGSIPKLYEEHLVPLIFAPYAEDLANRLGSRSLVRVLEVAAGTGRNLQAVRRLAAVNRQLIRGHIDKELRSVRYLDPSSRELRRCTCRSRPGGD